MSLFDDASLVMIPSGYKEDVVYSVKPTDGSGDLTFTRASDGTRVNSQGLVERVPWNLLQQSNTFSTSPWTKSATVTLTSGQTGYDGSSNAWLFEKDAAGFRLVVQSISGYSGNLTLSIYAKANTNTNFILRCIGGTDAQGFFNLSNGTLTAPAVNCTATITPISDGWYLCSINFTTTSTTSVNIYPDYPFGGTNAGSIYIQDAQLNEGTLKPYFPTTDRLNVPRLDYSGGCPSLLLEPQRTNSVLYSEQFDNAWWTKTNSSITANATISPDGTANADKVIEGASGGVHYVNSTFMANQVGTFSIYAKAGERRYVTISKNSGGTNYGTATFDLVDGVVTQEDESATSEPSIENRGNGWFRLSVYFSASAAGFVTFGLSNSATYTPSTIGFNSYTGDGTSGAYFWGAQCELGGATYPTSYIPTTSASVTRVADAAYKTGISSLIGQTEGTLFVEFIYSNASLSGNPSQYFSISDGTSNERIFVGEDSGTTGKINARVIDGNVLKVNFLSSFNMVLGQRYKAAIAYKANDFAFYVNGVQVGASSSGTVPTMSQIQNNSGAGASQMYYPINQTLLFKTRLTNEQLEYLTGTSYSTYADMASQLDYTIQ